MTGLFTGFKTGGDVKVQAVNVPVADGWYAAIVPVAEMPMRRDERGPFAEMVDQLTGSLRSGLSAERSVYLNMQELHRDNNIRLIADYGQAWGPEMGVGVYPDAPPSKDWTEIDPMDRDYGTPMPVMKHTVAYLETKDAGATSACAVMAGMGALVQVLHQKPAAALQAAWTRFYRPMVQEAFASYPVFLPLLHAGNVTGRRGDVLEDWMGEAAVYVRESVEDRGLFVLSRRDLVDPLLRARRGTYLGPAEEGLGTRQATGGLCHRRFCRRALWGIRPGVRLPSGPGPQARSCSWMTSGGAMRTVVP